MKTIQELRESRGLTQAELSAALGIAQNTLSNYEHGNRDPSLAMLVKIADYFGTSVDYLLEREGGHISLSPKDVAQLLSEAHAASGLDHRTVVSRLSSSGISITEEDLRSYYSGSPDIPLPVFNALVEIYGITFQLDTFGLFHYADPRLNEQPLSPRYQQLLASFRSMFHDPELVAPFVEEQKSLPPYDQNLDL